MADTENQAAADPHHQGQASASGSPGPTPAPNTQSKPKNIVLLSDGTGNSAGKLFKTNVWRLYQALDLTSGETQIAMYDDGVGTSGSKILKTLGGAFGWGLSRDVRELYRFLCQHYQDGDRIYIFGFSRGAFAARVLAGLIVKCGILDPEKKVFRSTLLRRKRKGIQLNTDDGRSIGVKLAHQSYRRGYPARVATLVRAVRDVVRMVIGKPTVLKPDQFRETYSRAGWNKISFIGVWDTVDAVGLPIDELSIMVDRIFYPHRFPDQDLAPEVDRACHAIAVDDQRNTFHPVLWNEKGTQDSQRITQVWFTGMHANVGGGYPDDGLAHVSLNWMIGQVERKAGVGEGLIFNKEKLAEIAQKSQPLSKMYDSRAGLALYYRFKPRRIASLCQDRSARIEIDEPKIHESVFERIERDTAGYAPAGIPTTYRLVDKDGGVSEVNPGSYESGGDRRERAKFLDRAQSHIFWRRVNYFLTLMVTLGLVLLPHWRPPVPGRELEGLLGNLGDVFSAASPFLPAFLDYWTDGWTQSPGPFLVLLAVYGALLWHARWVKANTHRLAEAGWWRVKKPPGSTPQVSDPGPFERAATRIRTSEWAKALYGWSTKKAMPVLVLILTCLVVAGVVYRVAVHRPAVAGGICNKWAYEESKRGERIRKVGHATDHGTMFNFQTNSPCLDTGLELVAGEKYTITVDVVEPWRDATLPAGPRGLSDDWQRLHPVFLASVPARRHLRLPWFALTAEIGRDSGDAFPIPVSGNDGSIEFRPETTEILHLYVNDAINSLGVAIPGVPQNQETVWYANYLNNIGSATITVKAAE